MQTQFRITFLRPCTSYSISIQYFSTSSIWKMNLKEFTPLTLIFLSTAIFSHSFCLSLLSPSFSYHNIKKKSLSLLFPAFLFVFVNGCSALAHRMRESHRSFSLSLAGFGSLFSWLPAALAVFAVLRSLRCAIQLDFAHNLQLIKVNVVK